jgi:hypothetical protein
MIGVRSREVLSLFGGTAARPVAAPVFTLMVTPACVRNSGKPLKDII